jgi:hypothetical protein
LQQGEDRKLRPATLCLFLSVALCGCVSSHSFYLVGRQTGIAGTGVVPANGHRGGPIAITLGGKEYRGQWLYVESGGSVGLAFASAHSGEQTATAGGTFVGLPTGGNGTVLASGPDGSTLRCEFYFSEWNLKGTGVCQDNKGETYDLQIS